MVSRAMARTAQRGALTLLALLACGARGAAAQSPDTVRLTLDDVVTRALRTSPQVVQAQGSVQTAESAERTALGAFLPSLSFSSGAALSSTQRFDSNTNTVVSGSADSYSAGLSSSIEL